MDDEPPPNEELISDINDYYENLLGYSMTDTTLKQFSENQWNSFCKEYDLNKDSSGIYLPRNQTAIIPKRNSLSLFHEYFGHGLYCEQSLLGKMLVDLEKKLLEEEKIEFQNKKFTLEEIQEFRKQDETYKRLENFRRQNLGVYEAFAIFSEFFLSREFNLMNKFEEKYDSLSKQDKEKIENVISFNKDYGDLATFYNFGLARITTPERVKKLLKGIYKDKLENIKLALLYGSRKKFSDIDVFIISEDLPSIDSSWLDVRIENERGFNEMVDNFDISIVGPILDSEYLIGNKTLLERSIRQLKKQKINEKMIKYNIGRAEEQKRFALNYPQNSEDRQRGFSYVHSYLANALSLKQGKKIFSQNEKFIVAEGDKI